jgi:hypothetical protein
MNCEMRSIKINQDHLNSTLDQILHSFTVLADSETIKGIQYPIEAPDKDGLITLNLKIEKEVTH